MSKVAPWPGRYLQVSNSPDYYDLLHVQPDAPAAIIKASYRAMMQKLRHHPDLGGDASVAQMLNEAADTLCDPIKRKVYDRQRLTGQDQSRASAPTAKDTDSGSKARSSCSDANSDADKDNSSGENQDRDKDRTARPDQKAHTSKKKHEKAHTHQSESATRQNSAQRNNTASREQADYPKFPSRTQCPFCHAPYAQQLPISIAYDCPAVCLRCGGASKPIQTFTESSAEELRRIYRHQFQANVELWPNWPAKESIQASLSDLSLAGCAIECNSALAFDQIVLVKTDAINAICQVCYCKQKESTAPAAARQYSLGLAFLTLHIDAAPGAVFSATA